MSVAKSVPSFGLGVLFSRPVYERIHEAIRRWSTNESTMNSLRGYLVTTAADGACTGGPPRDLDEVTRYDRHRRSGILGFHPSFSRGDRLATTPKCRKK